MTDILDKLKNRKRTTVSIRDNSLIPEVTSEENFTQDLSVENHSSSLINSNEVSSRVAALPLVADRRQIRLEIAIDQELEHLCKSQPKGKKMTVETFLEAAFLACKNDPALMEQVMNVAANRLLRRKEAGKLRRVLSQLE